MNLNLYINRLVEGLPAIEIVERKGLGHPDTICDLIVDQLSIRLSQIYLKEFGTIPHYNIDKAFLSAGQVKSEFGGGKIIAPMLFIVGDRATERVGRKKINLKKVVNEEVYAFLKSNYRFINKKSFVIQNVMKPGSSALTDIFKRKDNFLPANDTSALVGYAPKTVLERQVMAIEKFINSTQFKQKYPETGEDVKVMGQRKNGSFSFTIVIAFVDRYIKNEEDYFKKRRIVEQEIKKFAAGRLGHEAKIIINPLDKKGRGKDGCYLTVTGTSAEAGDSGEVGRGNRVNGLIPLNRPAGSEAAAGKNNISHVGKIYNLLCFKIAQEIYEKTKKKNVVWITSQIGQPVNKPSLVSVQIDKNGGREKDAVASIVKKNFDQLDEFINDLIAGAFRVS